MKTSALCKHLRTKSMFIPALAQAQTETENAQADCSSHCWCNRTLTETGPDDQPVGTERCTPTRACFKH